MSAMSGISAKLLPGRGNRARNQRNLNGPLELDPGKLVQLTLNRDAIQALTLAQAKVQVTIAAGGTTAVLISEETGKQIGGLDDLTKLTGLRAYVARERKTTASSESQEEAMLTAYRSFKYEKEKNDAYEQRKLDNSYVVATKPYRTMFETVSELRDRVKENYNTDSGEDTKTYLTEYANAIRVCICATVHGICKGEKEKGLFDQLLFDKGVPAFVKNKLTSKSLVVTKDMDLSRVLFPGDPSKGFRLTVKEWRSKDFVKKQGPLMMNSEFIMKIVQNDELFFELSGLTAEQWANAEDPKVQRVQKSHILVVPPFEDHKRVLSLQSKQNFRGFGLPPTAMDQSKDRLLNLCAVPLRAYAFSIRMAENLTDFFDRVFPSGTIQPPDEKLGNYAKQAIEALDKGVSCNLLAAIRVQKFGPSMMRWVCRECKIIPGGDLCKKIASALGIKEVEHTGSLELEAGKSLFSNEKEKFVPIITPISTAAEKEDFKSFTKEVFSIKSKTTRKRQIIAASVLQRETKAFLKQVREQHSVLLAEAMDTYFRSFYSESVQISAVRIAKARFDELEEDDSSSEPSDSNAESDEDDGE